MSKLYNGTWNGVSFKVKYINRKPKNLLVFWDGDFAEFKLIFDRENKFNNISTIMKVYSDGNPVHLGYDEFRIDRDKFEIVVKTSTIYSGHYLEYWIGTPSYEKSVRVAKFEGSDFDKFFITTMLPAILGFIFSCFLVFLAWALGAITVNPQFWVNIF